MENKLVLVCRIEIDIVLVWASELSWFLCGCRKRLVFSVWIESYSAFVSGNRYQLYVKVGFVIDLVEVMGSK